MPNLDKSSLHDCHTPLTEYVFRMDDGFGEWAYRHQLRSRRLSLDQAPEPRGYQSATE